MNDLLWWLAQNTIIVALLVPPVLLACWMLRHRPAVQHLLWVVVLLKLVTPPLVVWPWSVAELRGTVSDARLHEPSAEVALAQASPEVFAPVPLETAANLPANAVPSAKNWNFSILPWSIWGLGAIWFGGAVVTLVSQLRMIRCHARLIRGGTEAPRMLQEQVAALAREIGVRSPQIWMVAGINSPMVWCLGQVTLLWPESLSSPEDCQRLHSVIAHELAHLRRCDHWIAWLDLAARIVWWWNPLYWFVSRRVCESAEMACDAMAISTNERERTRYAKLLLEFSTSFPNVSPVPALGVGGNSARSFERRLAMILTDRVSGSRPLWAIVTATALAMSTLPAWSWAQQKDPQANGEGVDQQGDTTEDKKAENAAKTLKMIDGTYAVSGWVVDHNGKPIVGAQIWWQSLDSRRTHLISEASDVNGHFSLTCRETQDPILAGVGELWIFKEEKQLTAVTTYLTESGLKLMSLQQLNDKLRTIERSEITDGFIRLEPATDTSFIIEDPDGSPVVGVEVEPYHFKTTIAHDIIPEPVRALLRAKTDSNGRAQMHSLSRNWLSNIEVRSTTLGTQQFEIEYTAKAPAERTITLSATGSIAGRLTGENPDWVRGVRLYFTTRGGYRAANGHASATTDDEGCFTVPAIAYGALRTGCRLDESIPALPRMPNPPRMIPESPGPGAPLVRVPGFEEVWVTAGNSTSFDIKLETPVVVRGVIRTQDSDAPISGAVISVDYGIPHQGEQVVSDSEGRFEARVLAGDVSAQVIFTGPGFSGYHQMGSPWNERITVKADESPVDLPPIVLVPEVSLPGKVIDQDGKALPKMSVFAIYTNRIYGRAPTDDQGEFKLGIPNSVSPPESFGVANGTQQWTPTIVRRVPLLLRVDTSAKPDR